MPSYPTSTDGALLALAESVKVVFRTLSQTHLPPPPPSRTHQCNPWLRNYGSCRVSGLVPGLQRLDLVGRSHHPDERGGHMGQESMGGTSGVLLEIFFTAAARSIAQGKQLPEGLEAGVEAVEFYGGASVGSRTMIDALRPAIGALTSGATLAAVAAAARGGADSTVSMTASAGRANWVGQESYQGVPDPGAAAVAIVLEAMAKVAA